MTALTIIKEVWVDVPPAVLYEALTNSDKIVQYYPLKEVISTWQVGSEILLKGSVGDQDFTDYGIIEALVPNTRFEYAYWSDNHGTDRVPENYLTICYTLHPANPGTHLKLEHRNLTSEKMYLEMLNVWDFLLSNLKNFLETSG